MFSLFFFLCHEHMEYQAPTVLQNPRKADLYIYIILTVQSNILSLIAAPQKWIPLLLIKHHSVAIDTPASY